VASFGASVHTCRLVHTSLLPARFQLALAGFDVDRQHMVDDQFHSYDREGKKAGKAGIQASLDDIAATDGGQDSRSVNTSAAQEGGQ